MRSRLAAGALALAAACGGEARKDPPPDTAPPTITIVSPLPWETFATGTVLLRALVSDAGGLAAVEYSVNGGDRAPLPAASGGHEVNVPLPLDDFEPMNLEVSARDVAGNVATAGRSIFVDRVAPAVTLAGADAACADLCTGTVLRANAGPLHLTGTATDGTALGSVLVRVTDEGGMDVASATVAVDAGGAFAWDWDPFSLGSFFTITARADDPRGNTGTATRVAYVDRVPPFIASYPPAVGAPRAGPLVSFTEAMARASVEAVTTLSVVGGGPVDTALAWADAGAFGFAPALAPFTSYLLEIADGATDRAGNPLWSTTAVFETEMIPAPDLAVVATGARAPRVAVLRDGRPLVVYGTAGRPRVAYWDGRGAWLDAELAVTALAGGVADVVEATGSGVEALFAVPDGGATNDLRYARTADLASWTGWYGSEPELVSSRVLSTWSAGLGVQCLSGSPCAVTALFGDAVGARYATRDPARWSSPNLVRATAAGAGARGAANAFLDGEVFYLDARSVTSGFHRAVTSGASGVGRVVGAEAWRSIQWANPVVLFTTAAGGSPATEDLHLACYSATPWRRATVALPAVATGLALAVSSTTAALGVALDDGTVRFGTSPNGEGTCLADPAAPTWDAATLGTAGGDPSVAIAGDEVTVWKAWVRPGSGELVLSR